MSIVNVKKYVEQRVEFLKSVRGPAARDAQRKAEELQGVLTEIGKYYQKSPEQIKGERDKFMREERARAKRAEEKEKKINEIRARKAEREMAEEKEALETEEPEKKDE